MKRGDIVLYAKSNRVFLGKLGTLWSKNTWIVIPLNSRETVKRNEKFLTPIEGIKKHLTLLKKYDIILSA